MRGKLVIASRRGRFGARLSEPQTPRLFQKTLAIRSVGAAWPREGYVAGLRPAGGVSKYFLPSGARGCTPWLMYVTLSGLWGWGC
jgi:hypothetical protein